MSVSADHLEVAAEDHLVHFYTDAGDLSRVVGPYLATGLTAGGCAVVIATTPHRAAFTRALEALGVDVRGAQRQGTLVSLDAEKTLEGLLVAGRIDADAFERLVGELTRGAAARRRPIRVYGELVDLLWGRGHVTQALELEQLWNGLVAEVGFPLLCAYRSSGVSEAANEDAIRQVCHLHSAVTSSSRTPARRHGSADEVVQEFAADVHTPRAARHFLEDVLRGSGHLAASDDARLILSELVTNAVVHARSPVSVSVRAGDRILRLAVHDQSPAQPSTPIPDPIRASGRGLQLVSSLASDWGIERRPPGKVVWAELPFA